jgi:phospholipid/cholesterol/gamma-HCH transport system permease protein
LKNHLKPALSFSRPAEGSLRVQISGTWQIDQPLPSVSVVLNEVESPARVDRILFETSGLTAWDSGLLTFLLGIEKVCRSRQIAIDTAGLPEGVRRLVALAAAVPERKGARREAEKIPFLARVGHRTLRVRGSLHESLAFLGEVFLSLCRFFTGRARYRRSDLLLFTQEAGAQALPIVTLISALVGLILAFVGAVQLKIFGAQIFVANLVGLGMARDMGAMMTGIIMAGRTGAAYTAQLGTMQVNEEIDAFQTLGIPPVDFLVLPRMLALAMMMPLLTIYADLMGILGGALVSITTFDITPDQYYHQTITYLPLRHFAVGILKGAVYGVIVSLAGCLKGLQCGRSASAVGEATTSAVVTAIVGIIVSCAILTVIFQVIHI